MPMISRVRIEIIEDIPVFCRSDKTLLLVCHSAEWAVFLVEHALFPECFVEFFSCSKSWYHKVEVGNYR